MRKICVILSILCVFLLGGHGNTMLEKQPDSALNCRTAACNPDCPYLCANYSESTGTCYVYIEKEYLEPYWSRGEVPSMTSLDAVLCAIQAGHTHSFVFEPSMGCANLDCTNLDHTHYRGPSCKKLS